MRGWRFRSPLPLLHRDWARYAKFGAVGRIGAAMGRALPPRVVVVRTHSDDDGLLFAPLVATAWAALGFEALLPLLAH